MARLPVVDGDDNAWGTILNGFLEVSHNADGTLSSQAVAAAGAYAKPTTGIPSTDLANAVQTNLASASSAVQAVNDKTGTNITLVSSDVGAISSSQLGADNGVASLDGTGNVPLDELGNVPVYLPEMYGAVAGATGSMSSDSAVLTDPNADFPPSCVGAVIVVEHALTSSACSIRAIT